MHSQPAAQTFMLHAPPSPSCSSASPCSPHFLQVKKPREALCLKKKHVYHPESVNKMSLQLPVENMSVCKQ